MSQSIPAEPVLFVGFVLGFLVAWIMRYELADKIKDDAYREFIANQKGRIIPPQSP